MHMKTLRHILFASTAVLLAACSNEDLTDGMKPAVPETVSFTAVAPQADAVDTRTSLLGTRVLWNDGDAVFVTNSDMSQPGEENKFVASIPAGTAEQAEFVGSGIFSQGPYAAFYPFERVTQGGIFPGYDTPDNVYFYFDIPFRQTAVPGSFAPRINPAWAIADELGGTLAFKNLGALVKFTLDGDVDGLESVTLFDEGRYKLGGKFKFDSTVLQESQLIDVGGTTTKVTLEGNFEAGQSYYMVIAPMKGGLSRGFTFLFTKKDGSHYMKRAKAGVITNLKPGKIVNVGTVKLVSGDFSKVDAITDLAFIRAVEAELAPLRWTKADDGSVILDENSFKAMAGVTSDELWLDSQGLDDLSPIAYFTNLTGRLNCSCNYLTSLDVNALDKLERLDCFDNSLTSLKVSGCSSLKTLYCSNNKLTSLNVGTLKLTTLDCSNNCLKVLNLTSNVELTELYCGGQEDPIVVFLPESLRGKWESEWKNHNANVEVHFHAPYPGTGYPDDYPNPEQR